jgi:hypothetical protein
LANEQLKMEHVSGRKAWQKEINIKAHDKDQRNRDQAAPVSCLTLFQHPQADEKSSRAEMSRKRHVHRRVMQKHTLLVMNSSSRLTTDGITFLSAAPTCAKIFASKSSYLSEMNGDSTPTSFWFW